MPAAFPMVGYNSYFNKDMKKLVGWMAGLLVSMSLYGQKAGDSTIYYNGIPIYEDSVQNSPQQDLAPYDRYVAVPNDRLPKALKRQLTKHDRFNGWNQFPVLLDTNTDVYLIRVRNHHIIRMFGLDAEGRPVTYDEFEDTGSNEPN